MLLLALLLTPTADALTDDRSGPSFDLAVGGSMQAPPVFGGVTGFTSFGWWAGTYDDSYAIGRYWSVNLNARVDYQLDADLHIAPSLEVRRGLDLVVVGWYFGIGGGPVWTPQGGSMGAGGRIAFGGEFRRTRFLGLTLRVEAGVDAVHGEIVAAGAMLLGFQFSRPGDGQGVK